MESDTTIVIGGGLAGLTIAEAFAKHKWSDNIIVLEQYKQWGGRVATERNKQHGIQYEVGAGRIFHSHEHVNKLVKSLGLKTYPISSESFISREDHQPEQNIFLPIFEPLRQILEKIPHSTLAAHTIYELVPPELHPIFQYYPYWAEIHMLRADLALPSFKPTAPMGASKSDEFYGIQGGMDQIIDGLYERCVKAGVQLKDQQKVLNVKRIKDNLFEVVVKNNPTYYASNVVIATTRGEYPTFDILHHNPILKQVEMSPLIRIYAVYPKNNKGDIWFSDKKLVTDNPLRYIIPISTKSGLIMISYTDGADTKKWHNLDGQELENAIQEELRTLFPDTDIPKPTYLKKHDWTHGCTYWLPGPYKTQEALLEAQNPSPNLYLCGESVCMTQGWMEGALESAEILIEKIKNRQIL